jgi:hypothetical protein
MCPIWVVLLVIGRYTKLKQKKKKMKAAMKYVAPGSWYIDNVSGFPRSMFYVEYAFLADGNLSNSEPFSLGVLLAQL